MSICFLANFCFGVAVFADLASLFLTGDDGFLAISAVCVGIGADITDFDGVRCTGDLGCGEDDEF